MAKVTGPLFSMGASGKIADSMVFFPWKGLNIVRQWLKPANPQTVDQGDQRLILGGTGRAGGAVKKTSDYAGQLNTLELIPAGQTKQSYIVKKAIELFMSNATKFESLVTEYEAHTAKAAFDSNATTIGLSDFDVVYKGTTSDYAGGLQLYVLAKLATTLAFTGAPYTTALASWTATEVATLVADLAAAV